MVASERNASSLGSIIYPIPTQIGRYQILGRLGAGGMAEVLAARLIGPGAFERPLVLKRILPQFAESQEFVRMFLEEARIAAMVRHQNVVQIFDLVHEARELYLVMEYLEGETAAALARRLAAHKKLLAFGLAAHIVSEVAAGLHATHEMLGSDDRPLQLVHRDVSPNNIHLTYDGQVKIIDFGIATAADAAVGRRELKGKLAYMSPEQVRGDRLDRRSDIFSLGAVLYELSTCRRLFKRQTDDETVDAILTGEIVPPSTLVNDYPPALERIVLKAVRRDMRERYNTTLEMRRELLAASSELNRGKVPDESLGRVMQQLFGDRRAEKRALLKVSPEDPRFGTAPLTDPTLELPAPAMLAALAGGAFSSLISAQPMPSVSTPHPDLVESKPPTPVDPAELDRGDANTVRLQHPRPSPPPEAEPPPVKPSPELITNRPPPPAVPPVVAQKAPTERPFNPEPTVKVALPPAIPAERDTITDLTRAQRATFRTDPGTIPLVLGTPIATTQPIIVPLAPMPAAQELPVAEAPPPPPPPPEPEPVKVEAPAVEPAKVEAPKVITEDLETPAPPVPTPAPVVPAEPAPAVEPIVEKAPEPVVEKAPEPVVEKTPEPVVEKTPEPVIAKPEPVLAKPEVKRTPLPRDTTPLPQLVSPNIRFAVGAAIVVAIIFAIFAFMFLGGR